MKEKNSCYTLFNIIVQHRQNLKAPKKDITSVVACYQVHTLGINSVQGSKTELTCLVHSRVIKLRKGIESHEKAIFKHPSSIKNSAT